MQAIFNLHHYLAPSEGFCAALDLHAAINLTTLHLELANPCTFAAAIILLINPNLPPHLPNLRELVIARFPWVHTMAHVTERVDWSALDEAISRPQYAQLETLRLCGVWVFQTT
jgi:hypothetical protein